MDIRKLNITVTLVLTALAAASWLHVAFNTYVRGWFNTPTMYMLTPCAFSALAAVGWVLVSVGSFRRETETRCRRCGHILRGLTEPRCPECGERI